MTMIPYDAQDGITPRLVVMFPLNGYEHAPCERIYLLEYEGLEADIPCPFLRRGTHGDTWVHDTLADAMRVALSNSGWGAFKIENVT